MPEVTARQQAEEAARQAERIKLAQQLAEGKGPKLPAVSARPRARVLTRAHALRLTASPRGATAPLLRPALEAAAPSCIVPPPPASAPPDPSAPPPPCAKVLDDSDEEEVPDLEIQVPTNKVKRIVGPGGATIKEIQKKSK